MFFAEDRLPFVQQMILARDEKNRKKALAKLLPMQRSDFAGLFKAMDGFPVVIRTLDPPLHEFLPKRENLMVDNAVLPYRRRQTEEGNLRALQHSGEGSEEGSAGTAGPRRRTPRIQPDARPSRLPPWRHLSGNHRNAGPRHLRSCRSGGEEGREGHPGSHDPADRFRGRAEKPEGHRGSGRRRSFRQGGHEGRISWWEP